MEPYFFQRRFKSILILCCLGGIYIPDINKLIPNSRFSPVVVYFVIFYAISWFNFVDMTMVLMSEELPFVTAFELIACMAMICWNSFCSLHFLTARHDLNRLITFWTDAFKPRIYPEYREMSVKMQHNKSWEKCSRLLKYFVLPFGLINLSCVFLGVLSTPSMLGYGISRKASHFAILPQSASYVCWFYTYAMYQILFTLVLRLLLAELKFLKTALRMVLNESTCGKLEDKEMEKKLGCFIEYHSKVIAFSKIVQIVYTPTMLMEFFALTTFVCSLGYCATTGHMELDVTLYAIFIVGFASFMNSLTCRIGDEIKETGFDLGMMAFDETLPTLPIPIQKVLSIIMMVSYKKPITIEPFGMFPLLLRTFHQLTFLQYRFFRFVSDIRGH